MAPDGVRSGVAGADFAILVTRILLLPRNFGRSGRLLPIARMPFLAPQLTLGRLLIRWQGKRTAEGFPADFNGSITAMEKGPI